MVGGYLCSKSTTQESTMIVVDNISISNLSVYYLVYIINYVIIRVGNPPKKLDGFGFWIPCIVDSDSFADSGFRFQFLKDKEK